MPFTSTPFIFVFLPITIIAYYGVMQIKKVDILNLFLAFASLIFYAFAGLKPLFFLFNFAVFLFVSAKLIERKKSLFLLTLLIGMLSFTLIFFKYTGFFEEFLNFSFFNSIAIPLGISFIIFEGISYLIDVYLGKSKVGSFIDTLLFVSFFPKVSSGPIVLWRDFAPQLKTRLQDTELFFKGINRIMIGFAKKSIIADTLGVTVSKITGNLSFGIDSPTALLGALCYFLQIYYDFSGYSDIAIGISNIFGFNIFENFNYPYISTSIGEFWRRWHISLGSWFREYIYIPLGGNRKHVYLNLFIVFLITGIWHGSTKNFIIWGILHGCLSMLERIVRKKNWYLKIPKFIKWIFTMSFVYFTWIIFMLPSFSQFIEYLKAIIGRPSGEVFFGFQYFMSLKLIVIIIIGLIGSFLPETKFYKRIKDKFDTRIEGVIIREIALIILFFVAILFMINSSYSPFLYFQF